MLNEYFIRLYRDTLEMRIEGIIITPYTPLCRISDTHYCVSLIRLKEDDMAWFSPYRTENIGRLGSYYLDMARKIQTIVRSLSLK